MKTRNGFTTFHNTEGVEIALMTEPDAVEPLSTLSGQIVNDVIIGCPGKPVDVMVLIQFMKASDPSRPLLQLTFNSRAGHRWVPLPDHELRISPSDKLLWNYIQWGVGQVLVGVHTRGHDIATGKIIVNMSDYI